MKKDLVKAYDEVKGRFKLPEFQQLDAEFEISELEEPENLVRDIRKKIAEKIEFSCQLMEEILQPDTTFSNLYESRVFDEAGKARVFGLYRRLMKIRRRSNVLEMLNDDAQDSAFINEAVSAWKGLKAELVSILSQLEESWDSDSEPADRQAYFG
ncbi:hypothetical protein HYY72_02015 [Candidatus Woesearchaeota archaeon]|nr:hypothetical protein [Candidatus Woesearchaeota archaeon]